MCSSSSKQMLIYYSCISFYQIRWRNREPHGSRHGEGGVDLPAAAQLVVVAHAPGPGTGYAHPGARGCRHLRHHFRHRHHADSNVSNRYCI